MSSAPSPAPKIGRRFRVFFPIALALLAATLAVFLLVYQRSQRPLAARVRLYSLADIDPTTPAQAEIRALDFSREGSLLAVGLSNDTTLLRRLTGESPRIIGALKMGLKPRDRIDRMNVAIALAAPLVAIGVNVFDLDDPKRGHQGRIRIWNFETQESRDVWKSKSGFGALAISPMGDRVAVWDVEHHPLQVIDSRTREIQWRDASVDFRFGPLAFSPDGQCLAAGVDREIRTYKSNSGKLMRRCTGRMGSTVSIAFAADSSRIVTGGAYPTIRVWGVREAREDLEIPLNFPPGRDESVESVAFAPDSQTVLAFIPKFEKAGWWDRISGQRSVDSFDHVGTLILRHSLSEKVTKTVLDSNLLFTKACFCFGVSELAMCPEMSRNVEIWRY